MATDTEKLVLGLAVAVGTALLAFARRHGVSVPEPLPAWIDLQVAGDDPTVRAEAELAKWQGITETDSAAAPLLAAYWRAVGLPPQPPGTAWSAAFISAVAAPAVAPSANHIGYARAAWKARQQGTSGAYWAFQPHEAGPLQRGDIVLRGRGQPVSWADVVADTGHRDSHGDIVTADRGAVLTRVGGNVSNSVRQTALPSGSVPANTFAVLRRPITLEAVA